MRERGQRLDILTIGLPCASKWRSRNQNTWVSLRIPGIFLTSRWWTVWIVTSYPGSYALSVL